MLEYLLGTITSLFALMAYSLFFRNTKQEKELKIKMSQSRSFHLTSSFSIIINPKKEMITQSTKHFDGSRLKILMTESNAYWIKDNAVYVADIDNGIILEESSKIVDTMGMDKVELDELMFIVETLTEGNSDDSRNSRN